MTVTALTTTTPAPVWTALQDIPADRNPALVYLASLGSPAAVRTTLAPAQIAGAVQVCARRWP
jgi:hypothetical protein